MGRTVQQRIKSKKNQAPFAPYGSIPRGLNDRARKAKAEFASNDVQTLKLAFPPAASLSSFSAKRMKRLNVLYIFRSRRRRGWGICGKVGFAKENQGFLHPRKRENRWKKGGIDGEKEWKSSFKRRKIFFFLWFFRNVRIFFAFQAFPQGDILVERGKRRRIFADSEVFSTRTKFCFSDFPFPVFTRDPLTFAFP